MENLFTTLFPLGSVLFGVGQIFITGDTKDTALLELLGQRNHIVIEEADFTFVPLF